MARLSISSVLISATILIPIYSTLAEEANPGGCSIMTVVSDTGVITWSTDEAAAELISIAKDTNLSPEEIHSACHGEDAVQQAESEETAEEEKVEDVAAAEESADAAGEESLMSSVFGLNVTPKNEILLFFKLGPNILCILFVSKLNLS